MSYNYTGFANLAQAQITKFGDAATILRPGAQTGTYPATVGASTEHACKVLKLQFAQGDRDGTNVMAEDIKVMVSPDAEVTPKNTDKMRIGSTVYDVISVMPEQPGPTLLYWTCHLRGANGS